jgi:hypothetical protein
LEERWFELSSKFFDTPLIPNALRCLSNSPVPIAGINSLLARITAKTGSGVTPFTVENADEL